MKIRYVLNPLYWPCWAALGLMRVLILLPYTTQLRLGLWLGRGLSYINSRGRRTAITNINLCFPNMSSYEKKQLLNKNFESMGIFVFEVALALWGSDRALSRIPFEINADAMQAFDAAIAKGKGVLFAGPHFSSLEIVGRLFSMRHPFGAMYRQNKSPFLEHLLRPALEKNYAAVVERRELKKLIRHLAEDNLPFWYASDVDIGERGSVFAPFFGIKTATITAPARLAKKTGVAVLAVGYYRRENGKGYCINIATMPENYPTGDAMVDATLLNTLLEKMVRAHPDQYLWQYKRFKTRPNSEPRFYS